MANLETILSWFQTGDKPTQEEFKQTFSSFRHNDTKIPITEVDGLESSLNNKLNVNDLPANMALVDEGETSDVFNKEQIMAMAMMLSDYVKDGKIRADKIEAMGLTDLIESIEKDISGFAANSEKYEFQQNDFIAIPVNENFSLFMFKGGDKKDKNNYLPTGISNVTIGMVQGLQDELNKKIDIPLTDGKFYIKKSLGVTTTEVLVDDTLATVINKNNYSPKAIAFIEETDGSGNPGKNGALGANKNTYSFFFGNMNPDHTGVYNIALGYDSLPSVTSGQVNTIMGHYAAKSLTTGGANTVMGYESATGLTTGNDNTLIGVSAGYNLRGGTGNSMFGKWTGCFIAGSSNTFLGYRAGQYWGKGGSGLWSSNIVIGANTSGHPNGIWGENNLILGSNIELIGAQNNKFIINNFLGTANRWYATHFIEGNFADRWLRFDTSLQVLRLPAADESFTKDVVAKPDGTFGLEDKKDCVPLTGTESGKPITGQLEIKAPISIGSEGYSLINTVNGLIEDDLGSIYIKHNHEINLYANDFNFKFNESGISSDIDFSNNVQELHYVQKKYVDNLTRGFVTNSSNYGDFTSTIQHFYEGVYIGSANTLSGHSQSILIDPSKIDIATAYNADVMKLSVHQNEGVIISTPLGAGLKGDKDYSNDATDLHYVQKKYVDSKVDLVNSNDTQSSGSYTLRKSDAKDGDLSYMKIKGAFDIPANNFISLEFPDNVDIGIQKVTGKYVDEFGVVQYVDFVVETNPDSETRIINNSEVSYREVIINATLVGVAKNYAK